MNASEPRITDWVIDCDTHITESAGVWRDRLPAKWRDLGPRMVARSEQLPSPLKRFAECCHRSPRKRR